MDREDEGWQRAGKVNLHHLQQNFIPQLISTTYTTSTKQLPQTFIALLFSLTHTLKNMATTSSTTGPRPVIIIAGVGNGTGTGGHTA